jgi:dihydrofolate reductase
MDEERGIGKNGQVPWRLSADLRRFKALTMGHHLILGRKTWESIGQSLPGRKMVIVTRNPEYRPQNCPECVVAPSLQAALELARQAGESEAFIGGGGEIYAQALPLADRIYLTTVHTRAGCDVFFPVFDPAGWVEVERLEQGGDKENQFTSAFQCLAKQETKPCIDRPGLNMRL